MDMIEFKTKWARVFETLSKADQKRIVARKYKEREVRRLGHGHERTADLVVHPKYGVSVRKVHHGMTPKGARRQENLERDLAKVVNKRGAKAKRRFALIKGKEGERRYYEYAPKGTGSSKHRWDADRETRKVISKLKGKGHDVQGDWRSKSNQSGGKIIDVSSTGNPHVLTRAERMKAYGQTKYNAKQQGDMLKKALYEGTRAPNRTQAITNKRRIQKGKSQDALNKALAIALVGASGTGAVMV